MAVYCAALKGGNFCFRSLVAESGLLCLTCGTADCVRYHGTWFRKRIFDLCSGEIFENLPILRFKFCTGNPKSLFPAELWRGRATLSSVLDAVSDAMGGSVEHALERAVTAGDGNEPFSERTLRRWIKRTVDRLPVAGVSLNFPIDSAEPAAERLENFLIKVHPHHLLALRRQWGFSILETAPPRERQATRKASSFSGRHQGPKKSLRYPGSGSESTRERRERLMTAALQVVDEVGVQPIVEALGLSRATFYRRRQGPAPARQAAPRPPRALTSDEREEVLEVLHSPEYIDAAPAEVYSDMLSQGKYLCSVRTMYRVLESANEVRERRNRARRPVYRRPELVATGPNQVWSWDITKLRTGVPFVYLFLYVILDIFSRYVVGWMIAERETSALAKRLIEETYVRQKVQPGQLILHADNRPQMVAQPTVQLCAKLGIMRSHNRPYVSNDNPYSESQFATTKQRPEFPKKFGGLVHGLAWGRGYFPWYNANHHHSGLAYLTPSQVHNNTYAEVLVRRRRQAALDAACARNPERFVHGASRVKYPPRAVWINPPAEEKAEEILRGLGLEPAEEEVLVQ